MNCRPHVIDAILFDLGNVLINWDPRNHYRERFATTDEMEHFLGEICPLSWNHEMDLGKPFRDAIAERQQRFPLWADLIAEWQSGWERMLGGPIDQMVEVLPCLQRNGYRLVALTNWSGETFPIARQRYPWLATFDDILVSGDEGIAKPDPRAFDLVLRRNRLEAHRTVFIDDNLDNVLAGRRCGLPAIHFQSPSQCLADLARLGVRLAASS